MSKQIQRTTAKVPKFRPRISSAVGYLRAFPIQTNIAMLVGPAIADTRLDTLRSWRPFDHPSYLETHSNNT